MEYFPEKIPEEHQMKSKEGIPGRTSKGTLEGILMETWQKKNITKKFRKRNLEELQKNTEISVGNPKDTFERTPDEIL